MRIQLHPEAEEEIFKTASWYDTQRDGLGIQFVNEISRWFLALEESPFAWPRWPASPDIEPMVRRVIMNRFPLSIAYQAFSDRLWIIAVAHTSRRPFYWINRTSSDPFKL